MTTTVDTAPREHPILFSEPMIRAILEGRKTQTRRVIRPQPDVPAGFLADLYAGGPKWAFWQGRKMHAPATWRCPYGQPGDWLWVRETWYPAFRASLTENGIVYKADYGHRIDLPKNYTPANHWRPSIFMPRWASRIRLEIVSVRIQRLHEITNQAAKAEGIENIIADATGGRSTTYLQQFVNLWNSLNVKRGFGWDKNPWVWAIKFRRIKGQGGKA